MSHDDIMGVVASCTHYWTVTSPCPKCQQIVINRLEQELEAAKRDREQARTVVDEARAEVERVRKLFDFSGEHNVPELLDHYWQWSKSAERARVVAWLRGQGAWEKDIANAIEAGEHDK